MLSDRSCALLTRSPFRVGTHGLPQVEVALIRALCRVFQPRLRGEWHVVDAPPFDAFIRDAVEAGADTPAQMIALLAATTTPTLLITREPAPSLPNIIQRPLRSEMFLAWLCTLEACFNSAQMKDDGSSAQKIKDVYGALRYQLYRWPTTAVHKGNINFLRLSAVLSRAAFSLEEASELCQIDHISCSAFITMLQAAGCLQMARHDGVRTDLVQIQDHEMERRQSLMKQTRSWIDALRRRLGL